MDRTGSNWTDRWTARQIDGQMDMFNMDVYEAALLPYFELYTHTRKIGHAAVSAGSGTIWKA